MNSTQRRLLNVLAILLFLYATAIMLLWLLT